MSLEKKLKLGASAFLALYALNFTYDVTKTSTLKTPIETEKKLMQYKQENIFYKTIFLGEYLGAKIMKKDLENKNKLYK